MNEPSTTIFKRKILPYLDCMERQKGQETAGSARGAASRQNVGGETFRQRAIQKLRVSQSRANAGP